MEKGFRFEELLRQGEWLVRAHVIWLMDPTQLRPRHHFPGAVQPGRRISVPVTELDALSSAFKSGDDPGRVAHRKVVPGGSGILSTTSSIHARHPLVVTVGVSLGASFSGGETSDGSRASSSQINASA